MDRREQLREQYEDALFAVLMEELVEREGERLLAENERLKNDPAAAIPEEVERHCRKTIRQAFARETRRTAVKTTRWVLKKVLVAALIAVLLFVTAYAGFPEFRLKALNLLIEISDVATSLVPTDKGGNYNADISASRNILAGYALPILPEGFTIENQGYDRTSDWVQYTDKQGAVVRFCIENAGAAGVSADTEQTDGVEHVQIHEFEGLLVEKGGHINLVWNDMEKGVFITITAIGIEKENVLSYARLIEFVGIT